jgi:peroxiredoxin Q/BCP
MKTLFLILFLAWGFPMMKYRSEFRKIVYQTDDWKINIQPKFWKEMKGLFGNLFPENEAYLKARNFYRFYLIVYFILMALWRYAE